MLCNALLAGSSAPRARSARYSVLQFVKSLAIGSGYLAGAGLYR